jgi:glucose-6-phosphate 1-dehydrogenase
MVQHVVAHSCTTTMFQPVPSDLQKKTYPALFTLFRKGFLPDTLQVGLCQKTQMNHIPCFQCHITSSQSLAKQSLQVGCMTLALQIVGYARSKLSTSELHDRLRPFLKGDRYREPG